jgi:putative endonuclease
MSRQRDDNIDFTPDESDQPSAASTRRRWWWPFGSLTLTLGQRGERYAEQFLKRRGFKILARNYRCPAGEIDLIIYNETGSGTHQEDSIIFVEVKTRTSEFFTSPESAVDPKKQRKIKKVAAYYLLQHEQTEMLVQYDIVSILANPKGTRITHIPNAF